MDTSSSSASASSLSSSSSSGAATQLALAQSERLGSLSLSPPEVAALTATGVLVEPYLDGYATSNVTTQIGTHAYLPCRVSPSMPHPLLMQHKYIIILGFVWFICFLLRVFSYVACSVPVCPFLFVIIVIVYLPLSFSLSFPYSNQAIENTLYFIA